MAQWVKAQTEQTQQPELGSLVGGTIGGVAMWMIQGRAC